MRIKLILITIFGLLSAWTASAEDVTGAQNKAALPPVMPSGAKCVPAAAEYHKVNQWVLAAILKVESNFNAGARNLNANGTVDVGAAQINSMHFKELAKHGISPTDLMDICVSTYVAAWHLAKQYKAHGNTWFAVGAYHSATPCFNERYRGLVWNTLVDWKQVSGPKMRVRSLADCGYRAPGTVARVNKQSGGIESPTLIAFDAN